MESKLTNAPSVLVAGASGHLGRRVIELLYKGGRTNLIAASRNPDKLQHLKGFGIELRKADFNDPTAILASAFQGAERLLLISTDELQTRGLRIRQQLNAIEAAKAAGIKHIVYTSMPNPDTSLAIPFAPDHASTEQALKDSGLGYTILRVSWYAENLRGFLPQIIQAGVWPTVAGTGRIAYVPREDVARVAAAALIKEHSSHTYDITGTHALSIKEIASIIQDVFGRNIDIINLNEDQVITELKAIGIPEEFIPTVVMTDLNTQAGRFNIVTNIVQHLTGTAPQSLRNFLNANAGQFFPIQSAI